MAYAQTAGAESFELKKVGDGVWAGVAAARYKVNSNAAVIETNDGLVIVDSHSKPSAAQSLYKDVQGVTKKKVTKVINTHFHWDHWQGNQVYADGNPGLEIIASDRCKERLTDPNAMNGRDPEGARRRRQGAARGQPRPGRGLPRRAQDHEAAGADPHRVADREAAGGRPRDPPDAARPRAHRR
jgi:glyoxylase-like metal-dependent hydrolase (beta-lactamase superfamily II)